MLGKYGPKEQHVACTRVPVKMFACCVPLRHRCLCAARAQVVEEAQQARLLSERAARCDLAVVCSSNPAWFL